MDISTIYNIIFFIYSPDYIYNLNTFLFNDTLHLNLFNLYYPSLNHLDSLLHYHYQVVVYDKTYLINVPYQLLYRKLGLFIYWKKNVNLYFVNDFNETFEYDYCPDNSSLLLPGIHNIL